MEEKSSFDEFQLGPLKKQQLVYEHFKFPLDKAIPQITSLDVFKALRKFSHEHYKKQGKSGERVQMEFEEFLNYFIQIHNYDNPFEVGVKIQSIGLALQVWSF